MFPRPAAYMETYRRPIPAHIETVDLPDGVRIDDVTHDSAVLGTRTDGAAEVHVEYSPDPTFPVSRRAAPVHTTDGSDCTATVRLTDLTPGTTYHYRAWALRGSGAAWLFDAPETTTRGQFDTAPPPGLTGRR